VVDLLELGKYMISWHSQRPNIATAKTGFLTGTLSNSSRGPTSPKNVHALAHWMREIWKRWTKENPLGLNESLLAMRAYAPYHHFMPYLFAFVLRTRYRKVYPTQL